jgi:hypothetical protein
MSGLGGQSLSSLASEMGAKMLVDRLMAKPIMSIVKKAAAPFMFEATSEKKLRWRIRRSRLFRYRVKFLTMKLGKRLKNIDSGHADRFTLYKTNLLKRLGLKQVFLLKILRILSFNSYKNKLGLQAFLNSADRDILIDKNGRPNYKYNNFRILSKIPFF